MSLLDPGNYHYWYTQEAPVDNVAQPPGFQIFRGQRCLTVPLVSRAAESIEGQPSVIERMMDIGLFHQYVSLDYITLFIYIYVFM